MREKLMALLADAYEQNDGVSYCLYCGRAQVSGHEPPCFVEEVEDLCADASHDDSKKMHNPTPSPGAMRAARGTLDWLKLYAGFATEFKEMAAISTIIDREAVQPVREAERDRIADWLEDKSRGMERSAAAAFAVNLCANAIRSNKHHESVRAAARGEEKP